MSRYTVLVRPVVAREMRRLPRAAAAAIRSAIGRLADDPRPAGAQALTGRPDLLRLRVGDYRVLYHVGVDLLLVVIVRVADRKHVYDRLPERSSGADLDGDRLEGD